MIFQKTIEQVLSGRKTQTVRKKHPGDVLVLLTDGNLQVRDVGGRPRWTQGNVYAVQRERCHFAEAHIRVTGLSEIADPLNVGQAFVRAEGFDSIEAYVVTWHELHGTKVHEPCWVIAFELAQPVVRVVRDDWRSRPGGYRKKRRSLADQKIQQQLAKGAAKYGD